MPEIKIIGGGLVGILNAVLFAKRGYKVIVVESRPDPREQRPGPGKSINLAIGHRGMEALQKIGIDDQVRILGTEVTKRKIGDGPIEMLPGLEEGDAVISIRRFMLHALLLVQADKYENITLLWNVKGRSIEVSSMNVVMERSDVLFRSPIDGPILVCDGAHSLIRQSLLTVRGFDFEQKYAKIGYMDLSIRCFEQSAENWKNFLELGTHYSWRKHGVVVVGIVNRQAQIDKVQNTVGYKESSLAVSVFAKTTDFDEKFGTPETASLFFKEHFPLIFDILGEDHIQKVFSTIKPEPIVSVSCSQHSFFDKLLLMGDAAHAMVPFNGQGVNCGFEDCLVLQEIIDEIGDEDWKNVFDEYSRTRVDDTKLFGKMQWESYLELEKSLFNAEVKFSDRLKSKITRAKSFFEYSPTILATFSRVPYSEIYKRDEDALQKVYHLFLIIFILMFAIFFWFFN